MALSSFENVFSWMILQWTVDQRNRLTVSFSIGLFLGWFGSLWNVKCSWINENVQRGTQTSKPPAQLDHYYWFILYFWCTLYYLSVFTQFIFKRPLFTKGILIIYISSLYNIMEQELAQLVSARPSVYEDPISIPHSITSLFQLLPFLCSFD